MQGAGIEDFHRGTRRRRGGSGSSRSGSGATPGGAPAGGARCAEARGCAQSVSQTSKTGCSTAFKPGLSANIQPEQQLLLLAVEHDLVDLDECRRLRLPPSAGASSRPRGVTFRAPNCTVSLIGTSSFLMVAVTLSRAGEYGNAVLDAVGVGGAGEACQSCQHRDEHPARVSSARGIASLGPTFTGFHSHSRSGFIHSRSGPRTGLSRHKVFAAQRWRRQGRGRRHRAQSGPPGLVVPGRLRTLAGTENNEPCRAIGPRAFPSYSCDAASATAVGGSPRSVGGVSTV